MHDKTMEIREFEDSEEGAKAAEAAGFNVSLPKHQAGQLAGMNRKQRRAWLAKQRKNGLK